MNAETTPITGASQIIINPNFEPIWKEDLPAEEYHADRTAVNSSSLKTILNSPHAFHRQFIQGISKKPTPAMKFGTLAHLVILEPDYFKKHFVIQPIFEGLTKDGRMSTQSKAATEKRDVWIAEQELEGRLIVTQDELDKLHWMVDSFMANSEAVQLLKNGKTEISGYYADPETGIVCRFRPDFLSYDLNAMVDYKTVSKACVNWFRKNRVEDDTFRYLYQMSMYEEGTSIVTKKQVDFPVWILTGNEEPFDTIVVPMEQPYREIGQDEYHKSLRKLKSCIETNKWERQASLQQMHPSHWFLQKQVV